MLGNVFFVPKEVRKYGLKLVIDGKYEICSAGFLRFNDIHLRKYFCY